jgi:hypothetical protein
VRSGAFDFLVIYLVFTLSKPLYKQQAFQLKIHVLVRLATLSLPLSLSLSLSYTAFSFSNPLPPSVLGPSFKFRRTWPSDPATSGNSFSGLYNSYSMHIQSTTLSQAVNFKNLGLSISIR